MRKLSVILMLVFPILFFNNSCSQQPETQKQSEWVYPGSDGKLIYKTIPAGDKIMDFSHAGYMGGGVELPTVQIKKTVEPSGNRDDTEAIQSAVDAVSALPLVNGFRGAVKLSAGTFICSGTIIINSDGVALLGSGSGANGTTIKMVGEKHTAIIIGDRRHQQQDDSSEYVKTFITDKYVPSGAVSFTVADANGFYVGDMIEVRKPVTKAWVHFMQMDDMSRNGRPQTWLREGSIITTRRTIVSVENNKIVLDVPLSDSYDSKFLTPPGIEVAKVVPQELISQCGVENIRIQAPPMEMSYQQAPYTALRIYGEDCWAKDIRIEETMNSVGIGGKRITLQKVVIDRTVPNLGASKPAEFAPNGDQILLDRCSSNGDNIWHVATGGGQAGPIVLLNCNFGGNGRIEGHQRWTTGMLIDNCRLSKGGIDFRNRGSMGSGHGWGSGWSVAWNCVAENYIVQNPPGVFNWLIGCIGENVSTPRPFYTSPDLPLGVSDSPGKHVKLQSLYLAQLEERLGPQALENIGYSSADFEALFEKEIIQTLPEYKPVINKIFGIDVASHKLANTSNMREGNLTFGGRRALDGNPDTYWSTDDGVTTASLEVDLVDPQIINLIELGEAKSFENRVLEYKVEGMVESDWKLLAAGTKIGNSKVDSFPEVTVWKVKLTILKASASPAINKFGMYLSNSSTIN